MEKSNDVVPAVLIKSKTVKKTSFKDTVFPIVGIGASAGGLEALEQFLGNVLDNCNMAFVVVHHLDSDHKDMMCDLLQRVTSLKVQQITDRMVVKPNHVYVIPPSYDLTILNGVLLLLSRAEPQGLHLPIDYFFHSLAADKKEHSIAVILSGMGSDGTLGLRAVKDQAGAVFVQKPVTAKFDGMPQSAINSGGADVVAPAEELMEKIINHVYHWPHPVEDITKVQANIEKIMAILRSHSGHDFSHYKQRTIHRRIERRMVLHQFSDMGDYIHYLRTTPQENELLFKELLIGVTNFFRDNEVWKQLKTEVIPSLLSQHPDGGTLRAWVPACSTGEEAYTLAMVFNEALKQVNSNKHFNLQIFATDLNNEAIIKARTAFYPKSISVDISKELLDRYFEQIGEGYQIRKEVRDMVIFAQQSLIIDPPFTKLDIISCRNLLIYLEPNLQNTLFPLFHYSLNSSGVLVLGTSENIGNNDTLFAPLISKQRIYKRRETLQSVSAITFPVIDLVNHSNEQVLEKLVPIKNQGEHDLNLEKLIHSLLDEHFNPAALLTTKQGDIIFINGKTGNYLEPAAGKVNHNLFAMSREGLAVPLLEVFNRAVCQKKKLDVRNIKVDISGNPKQIDVSVQPLIHATGLRDMVLVLFTVSAMQIKTQSRGNRAKEHPNEIGKLNQALQQAKEELQITTNEMQCTQENLKSANEELQSMNEELQSTNEEQTSSKEELQSMNEELQTINHELNFKVSELSEASDDMKNLINSTNIATLFLDKNLNVRRFTTETFKIFKLISSDIGRPITDLVSSLIYPKLADDAREVLRSLIFHQEEVTTHDGRWYIVRIMPYRTQDNYIDGLVITFNDSTINRIASIAMTQSESRFRLLFENSSDAVAYKSIIIEGDKAVDFNYLEVNNAYSSITDLHEVVGKKGSELIPNILQSNTEFMAVCSRVAMSGKPEKIEYYVEKTNKWFVASMYSQEQGLFVCVTIDITDQKRNIKAINDIKMMLEQEKNTSNPKLKTVLINVQDKLDKLLKLD
jgi:two-component system CheB/CheR fusion protein